MSLKMAEKKEKAGYRKAGPCCGNCKHFTSEVTEKVDKLTLTTYRVEKKLRCTLHKWATKRRGWCPSHEWKE